MYTFVETKLDMMLPFLWFKADGKSIQEVASMYQKGDISKELIKEISIGMNAELLVGFLNNHDYSFMPGHRYYLSLTKTDTKYMSIEIPFGEDDYVAKFYKNPIITVRMDTWRELMPRHYNFTNTNSILISEKNNIKLTDVSETASDTLELSDTNENIKVTNEYGGDGGSDGGGDSGDDGDGGNIDLDYDEVENNGGDGDGGDVDGGDGDGGNIDLADEVVTVKEEVVGTVDGASNQLEVKTDSKA